MAEPMALPEADAENADQTSPEPLAETPSLHAASMPEGTAPAATNNGLVREAVPTEEAARIIEAVLAHVATQRGDTGAVAREVEGHLLHVSEPSVEAPKAALEEIPKKEPEITPSFPVIPAEAVSSHVESSSQPMEQPKSAVEAQPAAESADPVPPPQNFVRRWFVGR